VHAHASGSMRSLEAADTPKLSTSVHGRIALMKLPQSSQHTPLSRTHTLRTRFDTHTHITRFPFLSFPFRKTILVLGLLFLVILVLGLLFLVNPNTPIFARLLRTKVAVFAIRKPLHLCNDLDHSLSLAISCSLSNSLSYSDF
jgi:hypothetical protein